MVGLLPTKTNTRTECHNESSSKHTTFNAPAAIKLPDLAVSTLFATVADTLRTIALQTSIPGLARR